MKKQVLNQKLTCIEAAEILGVNKSRIRQLLLSGELEGEKFANAWAVDHKSLKKLIRQRQRWTGRGRRPKNGPMAK